MNRGTLFALMLLGMSAESPQLETYTPRDPEPDTKPPTPAPDSSGWRRAATEAWDRHEDREKTKRRKVKRRRRIKKRGW